MIHLSSKTRRGRSKRLLPGAALAIAVFAPLLAAPPLRAQATPAQLGLASPADRPSFDIASVKQNKSNDPPYFNIPLGPGDFMQHTGNLFTVTNMPLADYISFAYKLSGNMRYLMPGLPSWVYTDRFDIAARAESPNPTKDEFRLMLQSLLADRFGLILHHETRKIPVFALVPSKARKTGRQMTPHTDDSSCAPMAQFAVWPPRSPIPSRPAAIGAAASVDPQAILPELPCGAFAWLQSRSPAWVRMGARGITLQLLASQQLAGSSDTFDRPVVDRTGLKGTFDLWYEWTPRFNATTEPVGPSLQEALQEQLGLKVKSQKAPMDVMVIDRLEHPSEN